MSGTNFNKQSIRTNGDVVVGSVTQTVGQTKATPTENRRLKILFLAANPTTTSSLDLEEELRSLELTLATTKYRDQIALAASHALRPDDLIRHVRREEPAVLHFSGHGASDGIILRNDTGGHSVVTGESLRRFLKDRGIVMVVLNACYTVQQAKQIANVVDVVVGTTNVVDDEAARRFTVAFYRAIGDGLTIRDAFRDGGDAVALHELDDVFCALGQLDRRLLRGTGDS